MITFVYCWVCLLIVCCHTAKIDSEENDYNNDSPDVQPKVTFLQYKIGADVIIKCNGHYQDNVNKITWEFKRCDSNPHSFHCDSSSMFTLDYSEGQWKKLDFNRNRKKLEVRNATEENIGLYRCLNNGSIIKIYRVDIVVPAKRRPQPKILSLAASSNTTIATNTPVVIQCKAESEIKPEIRWIKECSSMKCEVHAKVLYNEHCYCVLSSFNNAYAITQNVYVSKFIIDKSRDIDSGTYVCLVLTEDGKDIRNVTIKVGDMDGNEESSNSFSVLFLIPLIFVLVPVTIWGVFYRGKTKNNRNQIYEQQKQLIQPVVKL